MNDVIWINSKFDEISKALFRGSLNYYASFRMWECDDHAGLSAEEIIKAALGSKATLGSTYLISAEDAMMEIRDSFAYIGDDSSYPGKKSMNSDSFKNKVEEIVNTLLERFRSADQIIGFWLKDGHPFYPVYWD
jgi:hypothetical protein